MLPFLEQSSSDVLDALLEELNSREIAVRRWDIAHWGVGICVEFADGFDAWFYPALTSSQTNPRPNIEGLANQQAAVVLADEFQRLDQMRREVLNALRHWAAESGRALMERPSGHWNWQSGGAEGGLDVSFALTCVLQKHRESHVALCDYLQQRWGGSISQSDAKRLLSKTKTARAVAWKKDATEPGIALGFLAFDEKALDKAVEESASPQAIADATFATRHELGFRATQLLIERIGSARFSLDTKCRAQFEYTDGGDYFQFLPRRRAYRVQAEEGDVQRLAGELESQYRHIDAARARFHNGWLAWASSRELSVEKSAKGEWQAGKTHSEYSLKRGRALSLQLQSHSPGQVLGEWLRAHEIENYSDETLASWCDAVEPRPQEKRLGARPGRYERLLSWNAIDIQFVDEAAENLLTTARQDILKGYVPPYGYSFLWWNESFHYRGPFDAWADDGLWLQSARLFPNDAANLWRAVRGARRE